MMEDDDMTKPKPEKRLAAAEAETAVSQHAPVPYRQLRLRQPMPPSLRRQFLNRRSRREMGAKGIPPWRARKQFRDG